MLLGACISLMIADACQYNVRPAERLDLMMSPRQVRFEPIRTLRYRNLSEFLLSGSCVQGKIGGH